jgi:hypothetical protein
VTAYEAIVENGQIKMLDSVSVPEHAKFFAVVPGGEEGSRFHIASPRLARPEHAADLTMEVVEEPQDASIR